MRPAFALTLLATIACTSDSFQGNDASGDAMFADADAAADVIIDAGGVESSTGDSSSTFCSTHAATFCDDFDESYKIHPWTSWTLYTPTTNASSVLLFAPGFSGQGLSTTSTVATPAFLTKQIQGSSLTALAIDVKVVPSVASSTLIRLTASGKTFAIVTDLVGANFVANGDANTTQTLGPANTGAWHHFGVTFANGKATVNEDSGAYGGVVSLPLAASGYALDIGIVTIVTGGGTVIFDNVLLQ